MNAHRRMSQAKGRRLFVRAPRCWRGGCRVCKTARRLGRRRRALRERI